MPTAVRRDGRGVSIQLAAIVAGAAFSAIVLAGPLWIKQGLVNDREGLFSLFVDNLFSLNEFGEPAWWHPGVQLGFPQYYISILGWTALGPIYVLLCGLAWLTGQIGLRWHSAYSPFLSPVFLIPSPLRAVNHYSDTALRLGFFALFLIGSAMGLESALRFRVVRRKLLPRAFAVSGLFSLALLVTLGGKSVLSHYVFGLFCVLVFLYSIALHRLATARGRAALGTAFGLILALSIVDTATVANQHLRLVLAPTAAEIKAPRTKSDFISGEFAGLRARRLLYLSGLDGAAIEQIRRQWPPLALLESGGSDPQARVGGSTAITGATFNRLQVQVRTPVAARLLWRDANSPFWEAHVNGRRVTIDEGIPYLKTVAVPAGDTTVEFRFRPSGLWFSILLAYLVILLWFIAWAVFRRQVR